jgi:putative addiction module component (TIGR02574 family)
MSATAERIRTEIVALSDSERAELALFLIRSLDQGADEDAEEAWDPELARRAEEIKNGQALGESADRVFSELRAKYS